MGIEKEKGMISMAQGAGHTAQGKKKIFGKMTLN